MFRYNFVPRRRTESGLQVVVADPADVLMIDELELLLGTSIEICVGTQTAIQEILKKSESSQRVLEEATEEFRLQIVTEDEETGEETLTIDKLTSDSSPIIKLIDSTIFNALQRRASDVHIETREREVVVKYRIDGVLYQAMEPIDKKFHSTIISRLKIMSELDISEKRIPQDGRFKLRIKGRTVDFRVSIVPTVHGEDCVIRILDRESMNKEFSELSLDAVGLEDRDRRRLRRFIKEPYGMVLVTGPTGSGKTTSLYAAIVRDTQRRGQDHHHRGPGGVPARGRDADPGEREEGADLRSRAALDPASRPGQGDGRRDPGSGDGAHRDSVGAHGTPGVHHGSRQQRRRRRGPLP